MHQNIKKTVLIGAALLAGTAAMVHAASAQHVPSSVTSAQRPATGAASLSALPADTDAEQADDQTGPDTAEAAEQPGSEAAEAQAAPGRADAEQADDQTGPDAPDSGK